ncbi:MAG: GAF domain-containing protein [Chitinispirillaceae bacterium]|nr:GAF domain-containing protein [Chitinispirillaceae bacterium]
MNDLCMTKESYLVNSYRENIAKLKLEFSNALKERDSAVRAAQIAVYNTTRITRFLAILSEPAPIKTLQDRLLALLSELFASDIVVILDPVGTGTFISLATLGIPETLDGYCFSNAVNGHVATVLKTNDVIISNQADTDKNVDNVLRDLGAKSVIMVPLTTAYGLSRGVMILARCTYSPFSNTDKDLLMTMGYRIGLSIEQTQRNTQLEKIIETGYEITRLFDISEIGNEAVRAFSSIFCTDAATIVLKNSKSIPECIAWVGLEPGQVDVCVTVTESLLNDYLFAATRPYCTPDLHDTAKRLSLELPRNFPVRALMAIPLFRNRHVYGLLYGLRFSAVPFSQEASQLAALFATQISVSIENARLYQSR